MSETPIMFIEPFEDEVTSSSSMYVEPFRVDSIIQIQSKEKPNIMSAGSNPVAYYYDLYNVSGTLQKKIDNISSVLISHKHDNRYYTKTDVDIIISNLDISNWESVSAGIISPKNGNKIKTDDLYDFYKDYVSIYSISDRDNIPLNKRVEGMVCFVVSQGQEYQLIGGLSNDYWVVKEELIWKEVGW